MPSPAPRPLPVLRWICAIAVSLVVGCASSQPPADAGVDLTVDHCDPQQLFVACSAQCHMPICIVAAATCSGAQWVCDCSQTGPCPMKDMAGRD
jgi:hypothetical protein